MANSIIPKIRKRSWDEPYETEKQTRNGKITYRHGFDGKKFWAEIKSINGMSPEEFKQAIQPLQATGLSPGELNKLLLIMGSLEEWDFPTRWETTDSETSAEGNIQGQRAHNLDDLIDSLSYYN